MASIPNPDVVQTNVANVFTASPQNVGTAFTTGETSIKNGQIIIGQTASGAVTPLLNFYSWAGGAAGNNGWQLGIDTANHGGGKDFFIARLNNGAAADIFYLNYDSGAMGLGAATPPTDNQWLQIISSASDTKACLTLTTGSGATGNALTITQSSGVPQIWVDASSKWNSIAGGLGLTVVAESTNQNIMNFTNSGNTLVFGFLIDNPSSSFVIKYITGGIQAMAIGTNGGVRMLQRVGFYGGSAVAQPNTTGTTAGFTAGAGTTVVSGSTFTGNTGSTAYTIGDIVNALKTLGLMAA